MFWIFLASFAFPLLLGWLGTGLVRAWALRIGFLDRPGAGHKQHARPVAYGGGIAITLAVTLPILLGTLLGSLAARVETQPPWVSAWVPEVVRPHIEGLASRLGSVLGVVGAAWVLFAVGLWDDFRPRGPYFKLAIQAAVALFVAWPLKIRAAEALGPAASILLTTFWIVLITNAFNFLDNMDGLCAGVAAIAAAVFAIAAIGVGQIFVPTLALVLSGGAAGFLIHNFHPAKIFMGDAGSLVLGFLLSVLTILTTYYHPQYGLSPLGVAVPLVVLCVPLYDTLSVVIHRLRLGISPFKGDRRHFSHRLVARGLSTRGAVLTIYLATAATGLAAIVLPRTDWRDAGLLLLQCACILTIIAILEHMGGSQEG